ncbi:RagB/SusD family nutrient uptake outer membrane protein [Labilibacter sediminis]|nr:RagB/SusD family nutrient uptake outer membrane protein [Labilibacter sediminis]
MNKILNKTYSKYLILITIILGLVSCEFLDVEPEDQFERVAYYENNRHAEMALAGVYGKLKNLYERNMSIVLNSGTDEFLFSLSNTSQKGGELSVFTYTAFDTNLKNIWQNHYTLISRANDFIYNIEGRDSIEGLSPERRQNMLGEALTLRALSYLNLVRMFEYIPLRKEPFVDVAEGGEDIHLAGSDPKDIYNLIIADLQAAIGVLPVNSKEYNRVSKYAAHGLLARTFLHLAGDRVNGGDYTLEECYDQVVSNCDAIINSGEHGLLSDYVDVFMNQIKQIESDREMIWEVSFVYTVERNMGGKIGNDNGPKVAETNSNTNPVGNPSVKAAISLNRLYGLDYEHDPAGNPDLRHGWNIVNYNINYNKTNLEYTFPGDIASSLDWYGGKWRRVLRAEETDEEGNVSYNAEYLEIGGMYDKWNTSINFPLLRYSDVLLMKAEALNELHGPIMDAVDLVDQIRERAGASDVQTLLVEQGDGLSQETFFEVIKDERSRELCFEGLRRFDLVRWGLLVDVMRVQNELMINHPDYNASNDEVLIVPGNEVDEKHNVFPIPNDELTLNTKISQHPLWN